MTGTEAFHPRIALQHPTALSMRKDRYWSRTLLWLAVLWIVPCFSRGITCHDGAGGSAFSAAARGADVAFPTVSPYHTIHVKAESLARQARGSYDVLAFRGQCTLKQGELEASCNELILWIDRTSSTNPSQPHKLICTMEGDVQMAWDGKPLLKDARWMGHLFSFQQISSNVRAEESRNDIPRLDWSRDASSAVIPAQYTNSVSRTDTSTTAAPPLLLQNRGASPLSSPNNRPYALTSPGQAASTLTSPNASLVDTQIGQGRASSSATLSGQTVPTGDRGGTPANAAFANSTVSNGALTSNSVQTFLPPNAPGNDSSALQLGMPRGVEPLPGAVQWQVGNATAGPGLPRGGMVIPEDGSAPYAATGVSVQAPPMAYSAAQPTLPPAPVGAKLLTVNPRSSRPPRISYRSRPEQGDSVATITGGVILSITGVELRQSDGTVMDFGNVSVETDNAVMWIAGSTEPDIWGGLESLADRPIELYLEGNIVLHQGERVIYADRMYYNVSSEYGMVLSAEMLTPVPQYQGLLRLKADVLEQRSRQNFLAYGAALTSSRMGVPRYWLQADRVQFEDTRAEGSIDNSRTPPASQPTNLLATSRNNFIYLAGVPITYWPVFTTNLAKPSYYVTSLKVKNDQIFGTQIFAEFDLFQLLGVSAPDGTDLTLSTDYLSKRGPALGARFNLDRPEFLFFGPTAGTLDSWFIDEHGLDTVGSDRVNMVPEASTRGRVIGQFRSAITPNLELWSELGYITDRNLMEQYFENEWDQKKDFSTALRLRNYNGNRMFDVWGQARLNDFFTETEWLPRADHFWLGQDLGEYITWSEHSSVGYAHQRVATTPTDPQDAAKFQLLPWETDSEGLRATTRQELNAPLNLGPWKVVPFISGEAAYWGEDVTNNPLTRLTGQGGVRTALPFWRAYPTYNSSLFDINGIAHKVTLENELFYADSSKDISQLPLYDPLDDNSQEHFRRRMIFNTFGGTRPDRFDERSYALRQGMQRYVTANSSEVVEDMTQIRSGINQRWQTKRGAPGRERIVDLVSLDVDWILFPKSDRDNFGEDVGAINYDFRYHIGDRLTLLSDGYFDVFTQGLRAISAGAMVSRPGRGEVYLGLLSLEGPISSNVLNGNLNYRLNEKWIASGGAAWDFGEVGSVGQSLSLTRVGESALIQVGMNVDSGRDNVSFSFNIEPRFLPSGRIGSAGGQLVSPAGLYGIE